VVWGLRDALLDHVECGLKALVVAEGLVATEAILESRGLRRKAVQWHRGMLNEMSLKHHAGMLPKSVPVSERLLPCPPREPRRCPAAWCCRTASPRSLDQRRGFLCPPSMNWASLPLPISARRSSRGLKTEAKMNVLTKLLSRKLAVTVGTILTVCLQISNPVQAGVAGAIA